MVLLINHKPFKIPLFTNVGMFTKRKASQVHILQPADAFVVPEHEKLEPSELL